MEINQHESEIKPDDHAARLESIAKAIERLQATAILEIAKQLAEARELFRYRRDEGGFGGWVESRLRYSRQTAYNLLHVYEQFGSAESVKYLDTFPASILYLLAAPSTPESARTGIIERAKAGEAITLADVKQNIEAAKAPKRGWTRERFKAHRARKRGEPEARKQPVKKTPKVAIDPKRDIVNEAFDLVLRMDQQQRAKFFDLYIERYGDQKYRGKFTEAWREAEATPSPEQPKKRTRPAGSKNKPKPLPENGADSARFTALDDGSDPGPIPECLRRDRVQP